MANILEGKTLANQIKASLQERAYAIYKKIGRRASLIGFGWKGDAAGFYYLNKEVEAARKIGIDADIVLLEENTKPKQLFTLLDAVFQKANTLDALLIARPLPPQLNNLDIAANINPAQDIDGSGLISMGRLFMCKTWQEIENLQTFIPCCPKAVIRLLDFHKINLEGKKVAVIGRSNTVGSPLAKMLTAKNAVVTLCHSKTKDLNLYFCYDADEPGQKATIRAISVQKDSPINARVVVWDHPELYKDPDEYIKGEGVDNFKKMLEKAEDIYTFLVKKRTRGMKPPFEIPVKEKLIQEFKELVTEIQSPIAKSEVIRKLSKLLDIEPNILEKEFESKRDEGSEFSKKGKNIVSPELNAEIQRQEWILKYLLEQPEEIEMVKSMLNADDFTDSRLRAIYETICSSQEAAGGTLKPAEILAMLDNEELVSRLSELITTLEDRPEVPFKECIHGLIRRRLETKLKLLQKRIRDAEDSGDDIAIAQISMEQLEVKRQFDVLVNSH